MNTEQEKMPLPCFKVADDVVEYYICVRGNLKHLSSSSVL